MPAAPPVDYIERTKTLYSSLGHPPYQWVANGDTPPWSPLTKALSECKLGVVASGGIYQLGQIAFHHKDDISYRKIPTSAPIDELRITHFAYDLTAARQDPNAVLPLRALNHLVAKQRIECLATNALTFMGGIYSSRKVKDVLAPAIVAELKEEEVDLAILIPVWPVCHQSVGLIARALEAEGIATVSLSSARSITQSVGTPRAVYLDYPLGQTAGRAGDIAEQNAILEETCKAFEELMSPGKVIDLPMRWAEDDAWKDRVMRPYVPLDGPEQAAESLSGDQRTPREATPQYQSRQDEAVADPNCERCIFLSESA